MKDVKPVVKKMEVLVKVNTNGSERSSCEGGHCVKARYTFLYFLFFFIVFYTFTTCILFFLPSHIFHPTDFPASIHRLRKYHQL